MCGRQKPKDSNLSPMTDYTITQGCTRSGISIVYLWQCTPSQIYTRDPRPPIPPCIMVSPAMGLNLGVFGFLLTTRSKTNAKQMHSLSLHATWLFTCDCLHAQTTVHAINIRTWRTTIILIMGKPDNPQFAPHGRIKLAQVLGSLVYIYDPSISLNKHTSWSVTIS